MLNAQAYRQLETCSEALHSSIGALIIRIGFGGPLYYKYNKELPKTVSVIIKAPMVHSTPALPSYGFATGSLKLPSSMAAASWEIREILQQSRGLNNYQYYFGGSWL